MKHNEAAAFHWNDGTPSVFASDTRFTAKTAAGKSTSQIATEAVVRQTAANGRSPGTITGISTKSDLASHNYASHLTRTRSGVTQFRVR